MRYVENEAKQYILNRIEKIRHNDKDSWNIVYGMVAFACHIGLISEGERIQFIRKADHAYFWGNDG